MLTRKEMIGPWAGLPVAWHANLMFDEDAYRADLERVCQAGDPTYRVLITCRHHACESTASYVVEGMMAALLAETEAGEWFRENTEVLVIPSMDKDGVEDGDQGVETLTPDGARAFGANLIHTLRTYLEQ